MHVRELRIQPYRHRAHCAEELALAKHKTGLLPIRTGSHTCKAAVDQRRLRMRTWALFFRGQVVRDAFYIKAFSSTASGLSKNVCISRDIFHASIHVGQETPVDCLRL